MYNLISAEGSKPRRDSSPARRIPLDESLMEIEMQNEFFVYVDRKPDGTPFYVGKGDAGRVKRLDRNTWHTRIRNKYPDWTRETITGGDEEWCHLVEIEAIAKYGRRDLGKGPLVNLTDGGEGVSGIIWPKSARKALSEFRKNNPMPPEVNAKISAAHRGKKLSEEHVQKIGTSNKGKKREGAALKAIQDGAKNRKKPPPFTEEHRANLGKAHKGKKLPPFSDEHKANISKAKLGLRKGIPHSKEHSAAISAALTGRKTGPQSEERRLKNSIAQKAVWAARKLNQGA